MKEQGTRERGNKGARACNPPRLCFCAGPLIVFLAAFVAIVPQLLRGNSCGHDFDVHLVSWLDCVNAWHHGILYPHWASSPNYGAGEPRFVFYPPLTWMLGAALGLVLPWNLAPIALTFLTLAATGLATRALALEALDDLPATLAGCAALFSGFALFTAYERSAFPEFAGGFWLPLVVLFAMRDRPNSPCPILSRFLRKGGKPQTPDSQEAGVFNELQRLNRTSRARARRRVALEPSLGRDGRLSHGRRRASLGVGPQILGAARSRRRRGCARSRSRGHLLASRGIRAKLGRHQASHPGPRLQLREQLALRAQRQPVAGTAR